ncbi:hypothetical protein GCM10010358_28430 [Streptomyces minutiscleroticus]|uniref:Uncharacterized protein n=1 Tax=Streptomyces minutiscleroticus TaxID=68238 RepID=A0A918KQU0_9ACTN|nr:hypothetical protein GCM10010358_28430 [Streptomyces minutiscleroticus]
MASAYARRHGLGVRADVAVAHGGGQGVDELRCDGLRVGQSARGGQVPGEGVGEPVGEQRAEDGGADAAADLPEVGVCAGGGAEVGGAHGVLHGEHEDRHHHADAGAEHGRPDAVVQPGRVGVQAGQQPHAEGGQGAAEDRGEAVAAGAADELPGDDRGEDDAARHGQHEQAGLGGRGAVDHLQEARQVAGRAEQGDADDQAHQRGDVEDGVAEQPQGDDGFGREALGEHEEQRADDGAGGQAEDRAGAPGVLGAAPAGQQHQAGGGGGQQQGAGHVEAGPGGGPGELEDDGDDGQGEQAEGHVDVEAPAPGEVVGEVAAEQRSGDRGEAERGADEAHVAAALPGRHDVRDDRLYADHESARADALQGAPGDELVHRGRPAGQRGAGDEDDDGELEDALAAVEVAELAVDGQADRRGEQVGGDRPGHPVQAVQLADDPRQRGGDDHLLQGGEQQREHEPAEDQAHPAGPESGDRCGGRVRRRGGRRGAGSVLGGRGGPLVPHLGDPAHVPLPSSRLPHRSRVVRQRAAGARGYGGPPPLRVIHSNR